jgi:hypothetical protein
MGVLGATYEGVLQSVMIDMTRLTAILAGIWVVTLVGWGFTGLNDLWNTSRYPVLCYFWQRN